MAAPKDPRVPVQCVPEGTRPMVFGKGQPEYVPLPALVTPNGTVITRWELTDEERAAIAAGAPVFVLQWKPHADALHPMSVFAGFGAQIDFTQT